MPPPLTQQFIYIECCRCLSSNMRRETFFIPVFVSISRTWTWTGMMTTLEQDEDGMGIKEAGRDWMSWGGLEASDDERRMYRGQEEDKEDIKRLRMTPKRRRWRLVCFFEFGICRVLLLYVMKSFLVYLTYYSSFCVCCRVQCGVG